MKAIRFTFSGTFMGILLVIFAIAIGYATFIENDYGAITAKMLIYNTRWFEILILLMVINFSGMIFSRQLYRKSKLNILVIHVALVIIIVGAAITRYVGFEGQMHIRQGQTTDKYLSLDSYFNVHIDDGINEQSLSKRIWLSPVQNELFNEEVEFKDLNFDITLERYFPNAIEALVPSENGTAIISVVTSGPHGRVDGNLSYGEKVNLNGLGISFGDTISEASIQFMIENGDLMMKIPNSHNDTIQAHVEPKFEVIKPMQVLQLGDTKLLISDFAEKAVMNYVPAQNEQEGGSKIAKVKINNQEYFLKYGEWSQFPVKGATVSLKFGNQNWVLPFSLRLNEFQLERYPGSMSPSSFASDVTVVDRNKNIEMPYRIFMNNILEYGGYRFYQSSYDQDEMGTILSVNHDYWGTLITYFGYFLLFVSLIISLFTKKTRFRRISDQIKEIHSQRSKTMATIIILLLSIIGSNSYAVDSKGTDNEHAASFGKLLVQNKDGRIIPINTITNQFLVKVYKKNSFEGQTADQVFLGMLINPTYWKSKPMIKVGGDNIQRLLGVQGEYASYMNFFNSNGQYKLKSRIDEAYAKIPASRNNLDKELINIDERMNVCYMVYNGSLLKILPNKSDPGNHWESPLDIHDHAKTESVSRGLSVYNDYVKNLVEGFNSKNYRSADQALERLKEFQVQEGGALVPSPTKINLEVFYNKINIFKSLFPVFMMMGIVLFEIFFLQIFKPTLKFKKLTKIIVTILILAFISQTSGLILRWYISGHAPWSNGYESMIYISWATMLAGFIFMKKSPIILSVTSLLTGVTLLTAHMSWLNPEITNLVPVLKSYWLTIHVATITASYGFLALGSLTAYLNLCIMIFRKTSNLNRVNLTLKELSLVIELSISVGLILLVIGNFLGGVWANESWGRYWGWDSKETWSLVTIIVYSFILHMRLIPGMRGNYSFNVLVMFGFGSVLMTYFGVNYYLSGLHSYASGDPVAIPSFVYYSIISLITISILAFLNENKLGVKSENIITK